MQDVRTITISLIRHAQTVYEKGTLPPYDPPADLSDTPRITRLSAALPGGAQWWISPLSRCRMTADALRAAGANAAAITTVDALEEQRHGDWHGKPVAEIWDAVKDGPKSNWHFLHPSVTPPNGESFDDLIARINPVMMRITKQEHDHLVIVAHGMVIRAMVGLALGMDAGRSLAMDIDHLSCTKLTYMAQGAYTDNGAGGLWHLGCLNLCY